MGCGSWGGYVLHIYHVRLRVVLRRDEVAVTCYTTFKGRESAARAVGTKLIHVDGGRPVVQGGGAARCARSIDGGVGGGGGRRPAASAFLLVVDRSGRVVHVAAAADLGSLGRHIRLHGLGRAADWGDGLLCVVAVG